MNRRQRRAAEREARRTRTSNGAPVRPMEPASPPREADDSHSWDQNALTALGQLLGWAGLVLPDGTVATVPVARPLDPGWRSAGWDYAAFDRAVLAAGPAAFARPFSAADARTLDLDPGPAPNWLLVVAAGVTRVRLPVAISAVRLADLDPREDTDR